MIFNQYIKQGIDLESYKERNLYYKIFAGYLFNELVEDESRRRKNFVKILRAVLKNQDRFKGDVSIINNILNDFFNTGVHVSFDFHLSQLNNKFEDRGEMSDVLLMTDNSFISIECKYLENMAYEKDVIAVQKRIMEFSSKLKLQPLQILLLTKSKWDGTLKASNKESSFYSRFQGENLTIPIIVLFWEDILEIIDDSGVNGYLKLQIEKKKEDYHCGEN